MSDHPRDCPHGHQWGSGFSRDLKAAQEQLAAADGIVRGVAAGKNPWTREGGECFYCEWYSTHRPDCLYLRAHQYVERWPNA